MNKRIRKKNHLGEFDYKGFAVKFSFEYQFDKSQVDIFCNEFLDFIEAHNLYCTGGFDANGFDVFITKTILGFRKPNGSYQFIDKSCTEEDRKIIQEKLLHFKGETKIGPLVSSWNSNE